MTTLYLTDEETKVVCHRLEVPDAIAEALECSDEPEDVSGKVTWHPDDVYDSAVRMCADLEADGQTELESEIDRAVIREAIEGSTWYATSIQYRDTAWCLRVVRSAAHSVGAALGEKLEAVEW